MCVHSTHNYAQMGKRSQAAQRQRKRFRRGRFSRKNRRKDTAKKTLDILKTQDCEPVFNHAATSTGTWSASSPPCSASEDNEFAQFELSTSVSSLIKEATERLLHTHETNTEWKVRVTRVG